MEYLPVKRALASVTDKTGLVEFASFLTGMGVEITSTGGTQKTLEQNGITVVAVKDITGFPEMLDGRVKTLHPHIHGGILANKDIPAHMAALAAADIRPYDLVIVNLYDFSGTLTKNAGEEVQVEQIDIGGPCLLRAAAKNFAGVLVLSSPADYEKARHELMANNMRASLAFRKKMAARAFEATARYDRLVADWLARLTA